MKMFDKMLILFLFDVFYKQKIFKTSLVNKCTNNTCIIPNKRPLQKTKKKRRIKKFESNFDTNIWREHYPQITRQYSNLSSNVVTIEIPRIRQLSEQLKGYVVGTIVILFQDCYCTEPNQTPFITIS